MWWRSGWKPKISKIFDVAIQHFKEYNLDELLISADAPNLYAYNRVERRMAPLIKALNGILLRHETFGTHLNLSKKAIDTNLEKRNFKAFGKILAKVWEEIVLHSFAVVADCVENASKIL